MNDLKERRLRAAGFKTGTVEEFLGLTPEESALIELRLSLARRVRRRRLESKLSQVDLARRIGSSQSRVAKLEAAEPNVSLDLLFRAFFATGGHVDSELRLRSLALRRAPKRATRVPDGMGGIDRTRPSTGARYNTVVVDPFKSDYNPSGIARKRRAPKRAPAILDKVEAASRVTK
jgi:transcriptional regulator with XRE-family HTH domain